MTERPVVLVTGASRGIGAHACLWLADSGADLAVVARGIDPLDRLAAAATARGAAVLTVALDVTERGAAERVLGALMSRFGRLDALINNAAISGPIAHLVDADLDQWRRTYETNLIAPVALMQACVPVLRARGGRIVNVTSEVADGPAEALAAYAGSKAALRHATRTLAAEEAAIVAIAYDPGATDTDLMDEIRTAGAATMRPELARSYRRMHDSGALVRPRDTSRILAWLALHAPPEWSGRVVDHRDPESVAASIEQTVDRPPPVWLSGAG